MSAVPVIAIGAGELVELAPSNPLYGIRRFTVDVGLPGRRPGEAVSFSLVTRTAAEIVPFLRVCAASCDVRIVEVGASEWAMQFVSPGGLHLVVQFGKRDVDEAIDVAGAFLNGVQTGREVIYAAEPAADPGGMTLC